MRRFILLITLILPMLGGCTQGGEWSYYFRIGPKLDFETGDEALEYCIKYMNALIKQIQDGAVSFDELISNEERARTITRAYCEPAKEREFFGQVGRIQGWIEWVDQSKKYPDSFHTKKEVFMVNTFWWKKSDQNQLKFAKPSVIFPAPSLPRSINS